MKNCLNKFFVIFFMISFFCCLDVVRADYEAQVLITDGSKCSLKSGSTGKCFYTNTNFNSVVSKVFWLDSGDKVKVYTDYAPIPTHDKSLCESNFVYAGYYVKSQSAYANGYFCADNLVTTTLTDDLKTEFRNAGFPESYWESLALLKTAHPDWNFVAIDTELDFYTAVDNQSYGDRSLIQGSVSNNYAYLANDSSAFDYYDDEFIAYDGSTWFKANRDTIAYYMDPRNFLIDMYVFQFQTISYDSSISDSKYLDSINTLFGTDYLKDYSNKFLSAAKESKVSPIYLASLSKQEVGNRSTPGTATSGKTSEYPGIYNFYNIGAYSGDNAAYNGLAFASNSDTATLRPWNTVDKAITGGAIWIYNSYLSKGQDTSYFKKYNVIYNYLKKHKYNTISNPYSNYSHQYMQNIMAPSTEANSTYSGVSATGLLDISYTFYIPVYSNMPTNTSLPNQKGWPNNYLDSLTINGNSVNGFDGGIDSYNYYLAKGVNSISIDADTVSSSATVSGLGTFSITGETIKEIKVTAQNGNVKTYKVKIIPTDNPEVPSIDVTTTLNNAGVKNGGGYISGIKVGSDINSIKNKITSANSNASVIVGNSGIVYTGQKISVVVGSEKKDYQVVIYGDVNGDGKIKAVDYVKIKNHIMGSATLSSVYKEAADVDKNGKISAVDYVKIKNDIMGKSYIVQ